MDFLNHSVRVKQWLFLVMVLMSGYATGTIVAKLANASGF